MATRRATRGFRGSSAASPRGGRASVLQLLERMRKGDAIALHCFYREVEPFLRSLARRALNPALRRQADSQDVAQSAFRRILTGSARARFEDEARMLAWMATIVRNRVRTMARHPEDEGGAALASGWDPAAGVDATRWAQHAEEVHALREGMARLAPRERQIVVLRDFEDLSYRDIASLLPEQPAVEALRKLHERAIARLRRHLSPGARPLP